MQNFNLKIRNIKITKLVNKLYYLTIVLISILPDLLVQCCNIILNIIFNEIFFFLDICSKIATLKNLVQRWIILCLVSIFFLMIWMIFDKFLIIKIYLVEYNSWAKEFFQANIHLIKVSQMLKSIFSIQQAKFVSFN